MKIKYRLRFSKLDRMRFIGHLDLMKLFQRCVKRAGLPMAYSTGYNPHPLLSFALPLSLGMGSVGEYVELEILEELPVEILMERLSPVLPDGLSILKGRWMRSGEKAAASQVEGGFYEICLPGALGLEEAVRALLLQGTVSVPDPKKRDATVDIRPHIYTLQAIDGERIHALISAGSSRNLKPAFLGWALYEKMGLEPKPYEMRVLGKVLYKRHNEAWLSLD